jgi:hypothetical protein
MPGTDEATRLTIARICGSPSARPGWSLTMTLAEGAARSRTKARGFGRGEMDARLGDRVDLLDRAGELGLARLAHALAFDGATDAHRQIVEDRVAARRRLGQAFAGEQHPRLVVIILGDSDRARTVDAVGDVGAFERGRDRRLVGIVDTLANRMRCGEVATIDQARKPASDEPDEEARTAGCA